MENWCNCVLTGVRDELAKVDRLADYQYLQSKILLPAVAHARQRQLVTTQEEAVLMATIKAGVVKAGNLEAVLPGLSVHQRTYQIRKLVDNGMLQPIKPNARQYTIGFAHNLLLRGVVRSLTDAGFIPAALSAPPAPPASSTPGRLREQVGKPERATQNRVMIPMSSVMPRPAPCNTF